MSNTRYVAFADVLGFGQLARANDHATLLRLYDESLTEAMHYGLAWGRRVVLDDGAPAWDLLVTTVNARLMSDSVVMWTQDDRSPDFVSLLIALRGLLAAALQNGIPMRGAVSWGEITHRTANYETPLVAVESLVGVPLVEAYEAERQQQWSGALVLATATERYAARIGDGAPTLEDMQQAGLLRWHSAPLKVKETDAWAVDWTYPMAERFTATDVAGSFARWGKDTSGVGVRTKIENTIEFARASPLFDATNP